MLASSSDDCYRRQHADTARACRLCVEQTGSKGAEPRLRGTEALASHSEILLSICAISPAATTGHNDPLLRVGLKHETIQTSRVHCFQPNNGRRGLRDNASSSKRVRPADDDAPNVRCTDGLILPELRKRPHQVHQSLVCHESWLAPRRCSASVTHRRQAPMHAPSYLPHTCPRGTMRSMHLWASHVSSLHLSAMRTR